MKAAKFCASLVSLFAVTCNGCFAQQTQLGEKHTKIEQILQTDLAMPGFGINSTRDQIMNRLQYALEHKWLSSTQVQQLCNEVKAITDHEESHRDENGKLTAEARISLAKQLSKLNDRFEDMVLTQEQANSDLDGLRARRATILQRISKAEADGKLDSKKAQEFTNEITAISPALNRNSISAEDTKTVASTLSYINRTIDEQLTVSPIASRELPVVTTFKNMKAPFASMSTRIKARLMQNQ